MEHYFLVFSAQNLNNMYYYLLQHSLSLDGWIVGPKMFVLIDIFLEGEQLFLQFVPKAGQSIPDMVGQLLVQDALQVRSPQAVRQVSV